MIRDNPKILFLGAKHVGKLVFEKILSLNAIVVGVISSSADDNIPLVMAAKDNDVPIFIDLKFVSQDEINQVEKLEADLAICVSYPYILPSAFLDLFSGRCLNFHPAKLPYYRGCLPTIWPILYGDSDAYYTLHVVQQRVDAGAILGEWRVPVNSRDTGYTLYQKMVDSLPIFVEQMWATILDYDNWSLCEQDESVSNYYPNKLPNNGYIDWHWSAMYIALFVRALNTPFFTGALGEIADHNYEVLDVRVANNISFDDKIGTLIQFGEDKLVVCGESSFVVLIEYSLIT